MSRQYPHGISFRDALAAANGAGAERTTEGAAAAAILDGAFRELASAIADIRQELAESTDPDVLYQVRAQLHDATMELMNLSSVAITKAMELK